MTEKNRTSIRRWYYADDMAGFLTKPVEAVLGELTSEFPFAIEPTQTKAWQVQIRHLQRVLPPFRERGKVYFEYDVPRMGKRIDVVLLIDHLLFVIEYKVGERTYPRHAILQAWDYALDLKNFHETSHHLSIVPVLIATDAKPSSVEVKIDAIRDGLFLPVCANLDQLPEVIHISTGRGPRRPAVAGCTVWTASSDSGRSATRLAAHCMARARTSAVLR